MINGAWLAAIAGTQWVDSGFSLMLAVAVLWCVRQCAKAPDARAKHLSDELRQTEQALRQLIGEAANASSSLDRALLRRRQELEDVLRKIEALRPAELAEKSAQSAQSSDDLPNESWRRPFDSLRSKAQAILPRAAAKQESPRAPRERDIPELPLDEQIDRISLSTKSKAATNTRRGPVVMRPEIAPEPDLDAEIVAEPYLAPDDIARKVALRLLSAGQEIHVVARKLELPLEEVRRLDRILRGPGRRAADFQEQDSESGNGMRALDRDIERELSLL